MGPKSLSQAWLSWPSTIMVWVEKSILVGAFQVGASVVGQDARLSWGRRDHTITRRMAFSSGPLSPLNQTTKSSAASSLSRLSRMRLTRALAALSSKRT